MITLEKIGISTWDSMYITLEYELADFGAIVATKDQGSLKSE